MGDVRMQLPWRSDVYPWLEGEIWVILWAMGLSEQPRHVVLLETRSSHQEMLISRVWIQLTESRGFSPGLGLPSPPK